MRSEPRYLFLLTVSLFESHGLTCLLLCDAGVQRSGSAAELQRCALLDARCCSLFMLSRGVTDHKWIGCNFAGSVVIHAGELFGRTCSDNPWGSTSHAAFQMELAARFHKVSLFIGCPCS